MCFTATQDANLLAGTPIANNKSPFTPDFKSSAKIVITIKKIDPITQQRCNKNDAKKDSDDSEDLNDEKHYYSQCPNAQDAYEDLQMTITIFQNHFKQCKQC